MKTSSPVYNVKSIPLDKIQANTYNPNSVAKPEMELLENLVCLYKSIEQNRPSGVKGKYIKTLYICSSMGPSIKLDIEAFVE